MRPTQLAALSALVGAALGISAVLATSCCGTHAPTHATTPAHAPVAKTPPPAWTKPYPETRRDDVVDTIFDTKVADPYRWLEDASQPEVQTWMKAQDTFTRTALDALPGRDALVARYRALMYYDADDAPERHGKRLFWSRKAADKEKAVVLWKDGEHGDEHVLLDPMQWASDGSIALGGWFVSWDGKTVAYLQNPNNADAAELHFLDVASGKPLDDVIPHVGYGTVSWSPDGKSVYYVASPAVGGDVKPPDVIGLSTLRRHTLGTDVAGNPVLRDPTRDNGTFLDGSVSRDGHWLIAHLDRMDSSDIYVEDLRAKTPSWSPLAVGQSATFTVTAWKDRFYLFTNWGAPRFRVMVADPKHLDPSSWKELVAEDPDATLTGVAIVGGHLSLSYLRKATSEVELRDLDGTHRRPIALPGLGTSSGVTGEPDDDTAYVDYTSFTEPHIIYALSVKSGKPREWARVKLPIDASTIVTDQVTYASKDGTPVTMFVVHRKDVTATGDNPTILYGYGGFDIPTTPLFSAAIFVWLERGGVWAAANLRGGGEYGEAWHQAGMLDKKQNVFDDYIAAAHWLIDQKWTSTPHLGIYGRSNGGLLVGAATTQAPELFGAVVCGVPLEDMIRYPLVGIGASWTSEYGSPDRKADFQWLYAYSPYHRVQEGAKYPPFLLLSVDSDDRVDPMHARKLVAALQWATSSNAPIYLRIDAHGGHHGNDQVKQQIDQAADMYLFLWDRIGK